MIVHLNLRILTDKTIFIQYQIDGKAKDGSFISWNEFIKWLQDNVLYIP